MKATIANPYRRALMIGAAAIAFSPAMAWAQDANATDGQQTATAEPSVAGEIVVTGTLLRGAPPVGSAVIDVGRETLVSSGATTANELLGTIPQVTNLFNQAPNRRYGIALNQIQIARPNIRNISADNSSSASTLVLFDGHRVASAGVTQASIDPDLIPTGAIERVEVVTDGGSAIYGADAVGGVINFITRKRFDGVKVDARYGFADNYWTADANATLGKDWGTGSAYVSYTFTKNDALYGRDRDFIRNYDYVTNSFINTTCDAPNITAGGRTFTGTGSSFVPGTTFCDSSDNSSFMPDIERHGVLGSLHQELSDWLSVDVRTFYSQRETSSDGEQVALGVPITSGSFYYTQLPGAAGARQTASFSLAPALGVDLPASRSKISQWGANAEFTADLTENWQLRTLFNYSQSNSSSFLFAPNPTLLNAAGAGTTAATAINPYNIAATDPALLARILDNEQFAGQTKDELLNLRGIMEGRLFELPGGDVRLAVGYEYQRDNLQQRVSQNRPRGALANIPYGSYGRTVHAAFGEMQIPIFGENNATPGIYSFVISAQGRYDHYSDFGGTFNPKFGATYKPVEWIALRGNWSESFNAPTPLDQLGSRNNTISRFPFVAFPRPGDNVAAIPGAITVALQGSQPDLRPQTAKTWSVGFDLDPPFVPGLRASLSYYNVAFKNQLRTPSPNTTIFTNFPDNVQSSMTGISADALRQFATLAPNGSSVIEPIIGANTLVYEIVDFRTGNFGVLKTDGLDWAVNYRRDTGFGGIDAAVNGNYQLNRKTQVSPVAPVTDEMKFNTPDLLLQATLGADIGNLRAQVQWNHTAGFDVERSNTLPQDHVSSFDAINFFFKYDVNGQGMFKDLIFTLNVNNAFDEDAPLYKLRGANGFMNGAGFTVGREIILGVSKQF